MTACRAFSYNIRILNKKFLQLLNVYRADAYDAILFNHKSEVVTGKKCPTLNSYATL